MRKDQSNKTPSDDDARMLTAKEVADRLRISVRGVWRQVSNKLMPEPNYIGRLARWPLRDFKEWMEKGCPPCDDIQ